MTGLGQSNTVTTLAVMPGQTFSDIAGNLYSIAANPCTNCYFGYAPYVCTITPPIGTPQQLLLTAGSGMCFGSACYSVAVTNSEVLLTITEPTATTPVVPVISPASTGDIYSDIGSILGKLGISSNPSNYAVAVFGGKSFSGNQWAAGAVIIENVNNYVGVVAGVDHLWGGGKVGSANIVAGGVTLKAPTRPLSFLSSNTNSWTHKLVATPYILAMVATPISGTGDANGGLGSITRAGINLDVYNLKGWEIGVGGDYGKRTGAGGYSGNWGDLTANVRKGF